MIEMQKWMELVNYRITEGCEYGWQCYGPNAYVLDSWNGEQEGNSFSIIFDTKTQEVYEVQAHDYSNERAYRMLNDDFKKKMKKEAKHRGLNKNEAWDNLEYVDLDVEDDFVKKCAAIAAGKDYDTRVSLPLELDDDKLFELMTLAHERDVTLNELVETMLRDYIEKHDTELV